MKPLLQINAHTSVFSVLFITFPYVFYSYSQRIRYSPEITLRKKFYCQCTKHALCRGTDPKIPASPLSIFSNLVTHFGIDFMVYIPCT